MSVAPVEYKIHSQYEKNRDLWINVLVLGGVDRDKIIELCKILHKENLNAYFHFYDNGKNIDKCTKSDVHYPNYPYPEKWAYQHYIGILNRMGPDKVWTFTPSGKSNIGIITFGE